MIRKDGISANKLEPLRCSAAKFCLKAFNFLLKTKQRSCQEWIIHPFPSSLIIFLPCEARPFSAAAQRERGEQAKYFLLGEKLKELALRQHIATKRKIYEIFEVRRRKFVKTFAVAKRCFLLKVCCFICCVYVRRKSFKCLARFLTSITITIVVNMSTYI